MASLVNGPEKQAFPVVPTLEKCPKCVDLHTVLRSENFFRNSH